MLARLGAEGRTALRNVRWKALSVPIEKAVRFLLVWLAARALGDAAFGRYQFAATVTTLLAVGTDLGLGIWTTRVLARDRSRASAVVGMALRLRALVAIPYALVVAVVAFGVGPGETRQALLLLGAAALAGAFIEYFGAVFRGYERLGDEAQLNVIAALLAVTGGLGALALYRSVAALAAGVAGGTLAAMAFGVAVLRRRYGLPAEDGGFDRSLTRVAAADAWPLWLATLFSLLYFKGDVVLLRLFSGDAAVGTYSAAYKLFEGTMILPAVILAAVFPPLSRAHGDRDKQRRWERSVASLLLAAGALVGAVLYGASAPLIDLVFKPPFAAAVAPLRILALAVPLLFLNYGLTHFLIARNLGRRNLAFAALCVLVNLGTNLVLIPRLGGRGAAWATLITELALTGSCLVALRQSRAPSSLASSPPPEPAAASRARTSG